MSNDYDQDVPFLIADDDDEDIFSSAPPSLIDEDDVVFSSASAPSYAPSSAPRPNSVSGGYAAVQQGRSQVIIGGGGGEPEQGSVPYRNGPASSYPSTHRSAHLEVIDQHGQVLSDLSLHDGRNVIGTGQNVDLKLDDPFLSKWHAAVTIEHGTLTLEDLSSINGIFLGIADEFTLEDGDELLMGHQRFRFHSGPPLPELMRPFSNQPEPLGRPVDPDFPHLIQIVEGGYIGGLYPLHDVLILGRNNGDVRCPRDPLMEDKHASIERRGARFIVNDLQSRFGTYIRVSDAVELINGDCFVVGRTRLRVQL